MKQIIFSLIALCSIYAAQAASCVTVQQVSTNYATNQVTFDLKWGTCNNTNHLYRVWVFVDYRPVTITTKDAWDRAIISATDKGTLVSANKGVWVTGSANATQRVTLTLNVIGDKFDWCAFAIDYPPNATIENGEYTLHGSPPFTVDGVKLGDTRKTHPAGTYCMNRITDATNNPDGFVHNLNCSCPTIQLGTVGFTSTQTWVVGAQTWSAPVTTTYCNKTTYGSPTTAPYGVDCRNNPGYNGHLFSWCMVARYAAQLCPSPWRAPAYEDYCTLDKTLNGRSDCNGRTGDTASRNRYLSTSWGGQENGIVSATNVLSYPGLIAYQTASSHNTTDCYTFFFHKLDLHYYLGPGHDRFWGRSLRCVQ